MRELKGHDWLADALKQLETYYWTRGGPSEKSQEDMRVLGSGHWQAALAIFYAHYAFERAGAPRAWAPLGRSIVERFPSGVSLSKLPKWAWGEFTSVVSRPNAKTNPLALGATKKPATAFVAELTEDRHNIVAWAARMASSGRAGAAFAQLQGLRGIGPKIAALFLRDVVTSHGIVEATLDDRRCILPVDVWVRRGISELAKRPDLLEESRDRQTCDAAISWADSHELRIATLDAGLWVLGARLARSVPLMVAALNDRSSFQTLVTRELRQAESAVESLSVLGKAF